MWLFGSLQEILPTKAQGSQQRGQRDVEWRKRRRSGEEAGREVEGRARKLLGFTRYIYFQPIVSSFPMSHLNLSLVEMKEHQLSLHMLKKDYCTREEQRLFGRNEVQSGTKAIDPLRYGGGCQLTQIKE